MVAITQRNLVFAHVLSMRSIESFEANLDPERLICPQNWFDTW
jgi:hypothetical protein